MRVHLLSRLLGYVSIFSLTLLVSCKKRGEPQAERPAPLPQDPYIEVYFNHNQAQGADYQEPYRQITRAGDDLEQVIVDAISSAQSTVDVAIQELRLPRIAQALVERHRAGVKVRVIIENTYNLAWGKLTPAEVEQLEPREKNRYQEAVALADQNGDGQLTQEEINQGDALVILQNAGVPLIDDTADGSKGSDLMHHKFVVVDGSKVVTGSANFTTSGIHGDFDDPTTRGNANNLLKIQSVPLAKIFLQEFNLMWGDGPGGKPDSLFGVKKPPRPPQQVTVGNTKVMVQFSPTSPSIPWPQSSNGLIGKTLATANEYVDLALFVFSDQQLANVLEQKHQQGVEINALIDPSFAYRSYSEGLDMLGVALSDDCTYEVDNKPWKEPIVNVGVADLAAGDKLHHKLGIVDNRVVITGSHNWSAAANHNNDETVMILDSPVIAAHFQRQFEWLFARASLGVPVKLQEKIAEEQMLCPQITTRSSGSPEAGGKVINVNTATQEELESLPGIGPALAQRIVAARPYSSLQDLEKVSGIGPRSVEELQGRVSW